MKPVFALSFAHLNLRRNPFGELSAEERTELAITDVEDVRSFLEQPGHPRPPAVQVIGEKGRGKTTHLLALFRRFPEACYTWLPEGETVTIRTDGEPIFVDEAQRLTRRQQKTLWGISKRLILGTHRDFEHSLRQAGRIVMTIAAEQQTSPERVHEIVNSRIRLFRRCSGAVPEVSLNVAEQLCERYGSDLRAMLGCLYEHFQSMKDFEDVREM